MTTVHERPGVYSAYDASSVVRRGRGGKVVGLAAKAEKGTVGELVTLHSAAAGAEAFGVALQGLGGAARALEESEIDALVRGGVTPLESLGGVLSPVRGITSRTKTGEVSDATWRELTTILIVDDVIPAIRESLRAKFVRSKNTARNRSAIRSQVIVELERKRAAEIIEGYGEVTAEASADDPTVCEVEFPFAVAHGLNQIYLTAHITV